MATKKAKRKVKTRRSVPAGHASNGKRRRGRPLVSAYQKEVVEPAVSDPSPKNYVVRVQDMRQTAGIAYITDPEARSAQWHYDNGTPSDPELWNRQIALRTFMTWCKEDRWRDRRDQFWTEVEDRVLSARRDQILSQRLAEIDELTDIRASMSEYLRPMKTPTGDVLRHPLGHDLEGLPMFPLKLPTMDKFTKMFIELDRQLMLKRGEATARSETSDPTKDPTRRIGALDPVSASVSFNRDDLRAMAKLILYRRQPELVSGRIIDVSESEDQDGDKKQS